MKYLTVIACIFLLAKYSTSEPSPCGNFNPTNQICCEGNLIHASGIAPSCCGSVAYDKAFSIVLIYHLNNFFFSKLI